MSNWQKEPYVLSVFEGDKKFFCMCGKSGNGALCDGSHAGTDKRPELVEFDRAKTVYICGCHKSGSRPFCDGSHNRLVDGDS